MKRTISRQLRPFPRIRLKPRHRSLDYCMAYLGAMCEMSYKAKKRRHKTYHFGLVSFHPLHSIRTGAYNG